MGFTKLAIKIRAKNKGFFKVLFKHENMQNEALIKFDSVITKFSSALSQPTDGISDLGYIEIDSTNDFFITLSADTDKPVTDLIEVVFKYVGPNKPVQNTTTTPTPGTTKEKVPDSN